MTEDWTDVLIALLDAGARFLVVGAHAMAVQGIPRATQDLDVWVEPTQENADRVWQALVRFGAPLEELQVDRDDFTRIARFLCRLRRPASVGNDTVLGTVGPGPIG